MHRLFVSVGLLICVGGGSWGCSSRNAPPVVLTPPPVSTPAPPPEATANLPDCQLVPSAPEQSEAVATVALTEPVNPSNAPNPTNDSERLVFRQLYETLIRVDCNGRPKPALAASWRLEPDGETWVVTLRENARFSDGTPVTSADILAAWTTEAAATALRPQVLRLIRSAGVVDDRALAVTLRNRRTDAPLPLAHTDLAIAERIPATPWPMGTRDVSIDATASVISLNRVRFRLSSGDDARDLLDDGVDLLTTRDPRVLDYAATLPQFQIIPLEWQRTHVFLAPGRDPASPQLPGEARAALASDAVRGDARGAQGPFWWEPLAQCEVPYNAARPSPSQSNGRIVYSERDAVARDLAERLVGLATAATPGAAPVLDALLPEQSRRSFQRATGLSSDTFTGALQRGDDAGYILQLERRPLDPCREMQVLGESIHWLDPSAIAPLVDTRLQAIVRRGRSGPVADWDGGLIVPGSER